MTIRVGRNNVTYFFDPSNQPVARVSVGDKVIFETVDCYNDELKTEADLAHEMDMSHMNPNTGPIFINGAEPGDILGIKILNIEPEDHAVATLVPGEGVLKDYAPGPVTKILPVKDGKTIFNEDIVIEPRLMIGTIGTTPLLRTPTGLPGAHGGNIDVPTVTVGACLWLPVFLDGALLQMGDIHSAMGDGEICIGMECGAEVTVEILRLVKDMVITGPVIENEDRWGFVADARTFEDAVRKAVRRAAAFLTRRLGLPLEDAALLISTACDVKLAQWADANYNLVVYVEVPKYLDKKGRLYSFVS